MIWLNLTVMQYCSIRSCFIDVHMHEPILMESIALLPTSAPISVVVLVVDSLLEAPTLFFCDSEKVLSWSSTVMLWFLLRQATNESVFKRVILRSTLKSFEKTTNVKNNSRHNGMREILKGFDILSAKAYSCFTVPLLFQSSSLWRGGDSAAKRSFTIWLRPHHTLKYLNHPKRMLNQR